MIDRALKHLGNIFEKTIGTHRKVAGSILDFGKQDFVSFKKIFSQFISPTLMALIQAVLVRYYPQCSGMSAVLDGNDCENGRGSVTPLRYAPYRRSRVPSVTDLTGIREKVSSTVITGGRLRSTAAAKAKPRTRSTVAIKVRPPRSSAATRSKPLSQRTAAARFKPTHSTANAATKEKHSEATTAMIHSGADLLTSTVITMPETLENENYLGNVDAINEVV